VGKKGYFRSSLRDAFLWAIQQGGKKPPQRFNFEKPSLRG
jgi:hypothetical protein